MKISADGDYWENCLNPAKRYRVPRGQRQCVELMMKMNSSPKKAGAELGTWLDGKLAMRVVKGVRRGPWSGMGFDLLTTGRSTVRNNRADGGEDDG